MWRGVLSVLLVVGAGEWARWWRVWATSSPPWLLLLSRDVSHACVGLGLPIDRSGRSVRFQSSAPHSTMSVLVKRWVID